MTKFKFPSRKEIKRVLKELENVEGSHALAPLAGPSDKFKHQLCENLVKYWWQHRPTDDEFSKLLGVSPKRLNEALHYHIAKFTIDELARFNEIINPQVEFKIAS